MGTTARKRRAEEKIRIKAKIIMQMDKKLETQSNKKTCNNMIARKNQQIEEIRQARKGTGIEQENKKEQAKKMLGKTGQGNIIYTTFQKLINNIEGLNNLNKDKT